MSTMTERQAASRPLTLQDVRTGLSRALREDYEATWLAACAAAGTDPGPGDADDPAFDRLLDGIAAQSPLCRVMAMSWRIRRTAARKLEALGR